MLWLYAAGIAVGCGAIKKFDNSAVEVKRMFVSSSILEEPWMLRKEYWQALEIWAKELGYRKCVLETGIRQFEAVKFYHKCGYHVLPNYGQYSGMENSICFEKRDYK